LIGDAALLIGDAAGLAYARSGEGIRPAIESGLLAAQTIIAADGVYDRDHLAPYARRVESRFGPRTQTASSLPHLLPQWLARMVVGRLLASKWFVRHVVLDRWFLHADQPALVA
jgi:flavin-dependent dehydrogenase